MKKLPGCLLAACLMGLAGVSNAAYNCSVSSPGFSTAYFPAAAANTVVQTSFTVTCSRALADATTMSYSVGANNGLYSAGAKNRAAFGASRIGYDVFKDGACGTQWTVSSTLGGTLNFGGSTSASATITYWGCVTAGQTGLPAGTYTDTVTMTASYGPTPQASATGAFSVSIATPAICNLTTAPGNIVFAYTGFGGAASASASYGVTCTSFLPYTMALDATSGTLVGVTYTLALSASSATGSGSQQTFAINGAIAAAQAGTCSGGTCTASQARTLTISY